ncbi:unnamed protein product [Phaeothamnion confervicola]
MSGTSTQQRPPYRRTPATAARCLLKHAVTATHLPSAAAAFCDSLLSTSTTSFSQLNNKRLPGAFGMNLHHGLEDHPYAFPIVYGGGLAVAAAAYLAFLALWRGMLRRTVGENVDAQRVRALSAALSPRSVAALDSVMRAELKRARAREEAHAAGQSLGSNESGDGGSGKGGAGAAGSGGDVGSGGGRNTDAVPSGSAASSSGGSGSTRIFATGIRSPLATGAAAGTAVCAAAEAAVAGTATATAAGAHAARRLDKPALRELLGRETGREVTDLELDVLYRILDTSGDGAVDEAEYDHAVGFTLDEKRTEGGAGIGRGGGSGGSEFG